MNINIDRQSPISLGDQLQAQIRFLIISGTLARGELLPTVQTLAEETDTNYNTVAAAYRALETQGYLVQRRRAGTRVADAPPIDAQDVLAAHLSAEVAEQIRALGLMTDSVLQLIGAQVTSHEVAKARPNVAVLAGTPERAASLADRARVLFGKELVYVPVTLTSYRSQHYAATLVAPALLESLQNALTARRSAHTPPWPNTYDFPAGAD